jgi:predicted PurR-regulated permease PerM
LIQSLVATAAYLILGVPSALALGMLTLLFSVVPAVGTAMVWAPVAAGLALTGRTGAAIALAIVGVAVISTVDNLVRPYLARRGKLRLPTWIVLVSMFGGVELIGGWGLLLGPLAMRLAEEALLIRASERG